MDIVWYNGIPSVKPKELMPLYHMKGIQPPDMLGSACFIMQLPCVPGCRANEAERGGGGLIC